MNGHNGQALFIFVSSETLSLQAVILVGIFFVQGIYAREKPIRL
jgi:hypothetical protein